MNELIKRINVAFHPGDAKKVWEGKLPHDNFDLLENALHMFQLKHDVELAVIHENGTVQPIALLDLALVLSHYIYEERLKRRNKK